MSVFPLKYKKKSSTSKRLITVTKWRVQIRRKKCKIDRVFDDEMSACLFEKRELSRLNSRFSSYVAADSARLGLRMPTIRNLLSEYYLSSLNTLAQSTIDANKNRCFSVIPGIPIQLSQCGNKLANYDIEINPDNSKQERGQSFLFGDMKIHSVDFWILIFYIENRRTAGIKANTILRELSLISSAYEKVYKIFPDHFPDGLPNPVKSLPRGEKPLQQVNRKRTLTDAEADNIDQLLKSKKNKEPYYLYVICLHSGARKGEVLGIDACNIDFTNWSVYLPKTKNGKPRSIMIPRNRDLREWLKSHQLSKGRIFTLTVSTFRYHWVSALKKLGLYQTGDRPVFHDTRRTALTRLIRRSKSNTFEIAKNIGVSTKTVEREQALMPEMLQDIFTKLRKGESLKEHEIMKLAGHHTLSMTNNYFGDRN